MNWVSSAPSAGAGAKVGTTGSSGAASVSQDDAKAIGASHDGLATFTVAKGGLMYETSVGHCADAVALGSDGLAGRRARRSTAATDWRHAEDPRGLGACEQPG
jgi:hypothetical protein